jgi:hypothetical protein
MNRPWPWVVLVAGALLVAHAGNAPAQEIHHPEATEPGLGERVERLEELGLRITADPRKIGSATAEAAYFMFAQRKQHEPLRAPFAPPKEGSWLEGKPVFTPQADKRRIAPLFNRLVSQAGYNEVSIYTASVHYGVDGFARFTLYKLGYTEDAAQKARKADMLLGDADYVLNLP